LKRKNRKLAEEACTDGFDNADAVEDGCTDVVEGEADDVADYDIDEVALNRATSNTIIGMHKIITKVRIISKYIKNSPKAKEKVGSYIENQNGQVLIFLIGGIQPMT